MGEEDDVVVEPHSEEDGVAGEHDGEEEAMLCSQSRPTAPSAGCDGLQHRVRSCQQVSMEPKPKPTVKPTTR